MGLLSGGKRVWSWRKGGTGKLRDCGMHRLHGLCSMRSASRGKRRGGGSTAGKPAVPQREPPVLCWAPPGAARLRPRRTSVRGPMAAPGIPPSLFCRPSRPSSPGIPPNISHAVLRRAGDAGGGTAPAVAVLRHGRLCCPSFPSGGHGDGGVNWSCRNDRGQKRSKTNGKH